MYLGYIFERTDKMKSTAFSNSIHPRCEYCTFGQRTKEGNRILCEKQGLVDINFSCSRYVYSPFKRIPVKQLNIEQVEDDSI